MVARAVVQPVSECKSTEKYKAAENLNGIEFESGKDLACGNKYDDTDKKNSCTFYETSAHNQLCCSGSQATGRTLIGNAIRTAIEATCHTAGRLSNRDSSCALPLSAET